MGPEVYAQSFWCISSSDILTPVHKTAHPGQNRTMLTVADYDPDFDNNLLNHLQQKEHE